MFIDYMKRKFVTIREIPELTLIDTAFATSTASHANGSEDGLELVISIRNQPEAKVHIPARPTQEWLEQNCTLQDNLEIWYEPTDGWVYGDHISKPFTDFLGKPVLLVYKGPTPRLTKGKASKENLGRQESVNFPDHLPVLVANEKSMAHVNTLLQERGADAITIERFRPNVIVKGDDDLVSAWTEDEWRAIRIINGPEPSGSLINLGPPSLDVDVVCRCLRCQVPNVEPETGIKHGKEPWGILNTYRRVEPGKGRPCFGMLCCSRNEGPIAVGMKVEVVREVDAR